MVNLLHGTGRSDSTCQCVFPSDLSAFAIRQFLSLTRLKRNDLRKPVGPYVWQSLGHDRAIMA
jgi:hypothetical protein